MRTKSIIFICNPFRTTSFPCWSKQGKRISDNFLFSPLNQHFQNQTGTMFTKWTYPGNLVWSFQCLKVCNCVPCWLKFLTHISFKSFDLPLGLSLQWKWTSWTFNLEVMCAHNGLNLGEPKAEIAGVCWRSDCFPHCERWGYPFPR